MIETEISQFFFVYLHPHTIKQLQYVQIGSHLDVASVINISDDYRGICLVADKDFAFESPTMRNAIRAAYHPAVELSESRLTLAEDDLQFAKLIISSDFTFILHVFLAECAYFLTYLDELTSHLSTICFS